MVARGLRERDRVGEHLVVDLYGPHAISGLFDLTYLDDGFYLLQRTPLDLRPHYATLGGVARISHGRRDHKAVELSLRQRVRPVELVRVLGGDDEEGLGKRPG